MRRALGRRAVRVEIPHQFRIKSASFFYSELPECDRRPACNGSMSMCTGVLSFRKGICRRRERGRESERERERAREREMVLIIE